jgi:hypothetical protein
MPLFRALASTLLLGTVAVFASENAEQTDAQNLQRVKDIVWSNYDTNQDGDLESEEVEAMFDKLGDLALPAQEALDLADTNADGLISKQELEDLRMQLLEGNVVLDRAVDETDEKMLQDRGEFENLRGHDHIQDWYEKYAGPEGGNKFIAVAEICSPPEDENLEDTEYHKNEGLLGLVEGPAIWYEVEMLEKYEFSNFFYTKHCGGLKRPHIRIFETTAFLEGAASGHLSDGNDGEPFVHIDKIPKHFIIDTENKNMEDLIQQLAKFHIVLPDHPPHEDL